MSSEEVKIRLIVDFSQIFYRCFFANQEEFLEHGWNFLRHTILTTLFAVIRENKPSEVILAIDSPYNWRKRIYEGYKAGRKELREKDDIDWEEVHEFLDGFIEDIKSMLPFKVLKQKYAEADDIIGVLCEHLSEQEGWENIILSSDKDFVSLTRYENTRLLNPKTGFVKCEDPDLFLRTLIIQGDTADNIPAIAPRVGPKTAEKLVQDPDKLEAKLNENPEYRQNLKRNEILIDLRRIPGSLKKAIIEMYNSYKISRKKKLFDYLRQHKLRYLSEKIEEYNIFLHKLFINTQ